MVVPFERDRDWPDSALEHEALPSAFDDSLADEGERCSDRRMSGHRKLVARRKDSHLDVARALRRKDERGLGKRHLVCDALHFGRGDAGARLWHDGELIAFERRVGEYVQL
jgi:hypothetical protein